MTVDAAVTTTAAASTQAGTQQPYHHVALLRKRPFVVISGFRAGKSTSV